MAYIALSNFKYGLDTRRSALSSVPGTLLYANNGHVTTGGEFEKRASFQRIALPAGCCGLEVTSGGLVTFGSGAAPAGLPATYGATTLSYVQLVHPAITLYEGTYSAAIHALVAVNWSQPWKGTTVVSATFADGNTFLYYNGQFVPESGSGIVLNANFGINTFNVATNFINDVNALAGWEAAENFNVNNDYSSILNGEEVDFGIEGASSGTFSVFSSVVSTNGFLGFEDKGTSAGVTGTPGTTSFVVDHTRVPYDITTMSAVTGGVLIYLCQKLDAPAAVTDIAVAAAICGEINRRGLGFTASNSGTSTVTITNPLLTESNVNATINLVTGYTWPHITVTNTAGSTNHNFSASTYSYLALSQLESGYVWSTYPNDWNVGDTWTVTIEPLNATNITLGKGNISGSTFPFGLVWNNQVWLANNTIFNYSSPGDPTGWETQNVDSGFIQFSSQYGNSDLVQSMATYQGNLAVFGRRSIQIWYPTPGTTITAPVALKQTLNNIGTFAPFSVQPLGDLDVMFLSDTGIRSLRARDLTLNAFVNDLGTPVDSIVQQAIAACPQGLLKYVCAIVEPTQNRYWVSIPDADGLSATGYVFSYFPSAKVVGWSTYNFTYPNAQQVQTPFVPQKFVVLDDVVWATDGTAIYAYGGPYGGMYDTCPGTFAIPFYDLKRPGISKTMKAVDFDVMGKWQVLGSLDWPTASPETGAGYTPLTGDAFVGSSFDSGMLPFPGNGSHVSILFQTQDAAPSSVNEVVVYYELAQEAS